MNRTNAALAIATLVVSAFGPAATAQTGGIMYHHTFYSDATLTTQVGWYRDRCWNGYVQATPVNGTVTPYYTLEPIGRCAFGGGGYD